MNIFVLDKDPILAASYLCDAHVIKMIVETCQLLSAADITIYGKPQEDRYSPGWKNHPCCKCLINHHNYEWLCKHLEGLLKEYSNRYNSIHSCNTIFEKYWKRKGIYRVEELTFPKCVGDYWEDGIDIDTVVRCYRNYYKWKKSVLTRFKYKLNNEPKWLSESK